MNIKELITIEEFNYTCRYADTEWKVKSFVLVIKDCYKFKDGSTMDATIYAENEDGEVINFHTYEEAEEYLNKYEKRFKFEIKHRDELHLTI